MVGVNVAMPLFFFLFSLDPTSLPHTTIQTSAGAVAESSLSSVRPSASGVAR
jgi:hypothetical protein